MLLVRKAFYFFVLIYYPLVIFSHPPKDSLRILKVRKSFLITTSALYTAGSLSYLDYIWYKPYASSKFHFFNDNPEWCQMDKIGHAFTTYNSGRLAYKAMRWAGYSRNKSIFLGEAYGTLYMTTVEIMDGFSSGWGFSWGDEVANVSGSLLFTLQQYFWDDQRILLKYSFHQTFYPAYRPDGLLGKTLLDESIKDYNGQSYWLSVNLFSFLKNKYIPKWLNVALGYGAEGMITGRADTPYIRPDGSIVSFNRYRKFYVSLDVDFTRIKTRSKALRTLFNALNCFKIPFPAIELNRGRVSFSPFYF